MVDYIICVTDTGGIPLFIRSKPGCEPLSFPVIGSLNGVQMFGLSKDVNLLSTSTNQEKIYWKRFEEGNIVLIAISSLMETKSCSDSYLETVLENVYHIMILLTGLTDLKKGAKNPDILKKNLRSCYFLIDTFLDGENVMKGYFGTKTNTIDVILNEDSHILQEYLNAFVDSVNSQYGCLLKSGRVICATDSWWQLTGQELSLIGLLISKSSSSVSNDVPIFLPQSNPNSALRLLIFTLIGASDKHSNIQTCVLCGPLPSLATVQDTLVDRFWGASSKTLIKISLQGHLPDIIMTSLPTPLLAFLLVNMTTKRCVSMTMPSSTPDESHVIKRQQKRAISNQSHDHHKKLNMKLDKFKRLIDDVIAGCQLDQDGHVAVMTSHYRIASDGCYYWMKEKDFELFAIYRAKTTTFSLQGFTRSIFHLLRHQSLI